MKVTAPSQRDAYEENQQTVATTKVREAKYNWDSYSDFEVLLWHNVRTVMELSNMMMEY